jgi:hypothetical protein
MRDSSRTFTGREGVFGTRRHCRQGFFRQNKFKNRNYWGASVILRTVELSEAMIQEKQRQLRVSQPSEALYVKGDL